MLELLLNLAGESFLNHASNANWSARTRMIVDVLIGCLMAAAVVYGIWDGCLNGRFWQSVALFFVGGLCVVAVIRRIVICCRKKKREPED